MSLRPTQPLASKEMRLRIEADVQKFLAKGGSIVIIETGLSSQSAKENIFQNAFEFGSNISPAKTKAKVSVYGIIDEAEGDDEDETF